MKILHKLKSHEDTINCLCWMPATNTNDPDTAKHLESLFNATDLTSLLGSSSEDGTIRVWCTDRGEQVLVLKAPGNSGGGGNGSRGFDKQKNKIKYIPLCWPLPSILISGTFKLIKVF